MKHKIVFLVFLVGLIWLAGCYKTYPSSLIIANPTLSGQISNTVYISTPEPTSLPVTSTLPQPTSTPKPVSLTATVWQEPPQAPILMYHRFNTVSGGSSYAYTTGLNDFDGQLDALYQAGFALVSLDDWLRGDIQIAEGKRPLIISIDDLFYADQISLNSQGQPADYSGIGHLWQFYQTHPDFDFHVALFFNLGDKTYANNYINGEFSVGDGWRHARAQAIAWCIENDAIPLNHFYKHPFLNTLTPDEIQDQLAENDQALREALALIGKESLAANLPNIAALPYVQWPDTEEGKQAIYNYISPEGAPMAGIILGDYATNSFFSPSPFSEKFDRFQVPRISASWDAVNRIISRVDEIPMAEKCDLGEFFNGAQTTSGEVANAILIKYQDGSCPEGFYSVGQWTFLLQNNEVIQTSP